MQHGQHDLQGRAAFLLVHARGNAAPVIPYTYGVVGKNSDFYILTETGKSLIDRIVHHLVHQMMQASRTYVSDIHRRTFTDCLQSLQHLNTVRRILPFRFNHFFICHRGSIY